MAPLNISGRVQSEAMRCGAGIKMTLSLLLVLHLFSVQSCSEERSESSSSHSSAEKRTSPGGGKTRHEAGTRSGDRISTSEASSTATSTVRSKDGEAANAAIRPEASNQEIEKQNPTHLSGIHRDRVFTIALRRLPASLDPLTALEPWGQRIVEDLVFEGLVRRQKNRRPWVEPQLADRWVLDDPAAPRRIDFHLHSGSKFHDGSELSVEDVVYTFSKLLDPSRAKLRSRLGLVFLESVEALNQAPRGEIGDSDSRGVTRWIRVTFSQRQPLALERISQVKIVSRAKHSTLGTAFASRPVGTGPMRARIHKDRILLERIESWSRSDRNALVLDTIVFEEFSDGAQGFTALRRNEVQLLAEVPPSYLPAELGKPGLAVRAKAWLTSPARYDLLLFNLQDPVAIDLDVRRAINDLAPQGKIAETAYHTAGLPIEAPVDLHDPIALDLALFVDAHRGAVGVGGLPRWPTDDPALRSQIAQQLDASGWKRTKEGRQKKQAKLRMTLTWEGKPGAGAALAKILRESWRSVGILDFQATAPWGYLQRLLENGRFQSVLVRLALSDDADLYDHFHSRGVLNRSRVSDSQLDRALEAYRRAETRSDRVQAEEEIAGRFSALRIATMLHAPVIVMLTSREVKALQFIDDLPRLDRLGWELQPMNDWYPPSLSSIPP